MVYYVSSFLIFASITWFVIEMNTDTEIVVETVSDIQEKELNITPAPKQIIKPKSPQVIEYDKKEVPPPNKIKPPPVVKVNKTEKKKIKKDEEESRIEVSFATIEDVPIFPGCERVAKSKRRDCFQEKINKHIRKNFRYPEIAQEMGIQGRVYINFIITKDGEITNIRTRGPDENLEKEAVRIISLLPRMLPGKQNGKKVRVPFSVPITFRLQ